MKSFEVSNLLAIATLIVSGNAHASTGKSEVYQSVHNPKVTILTIAGASARTLYDSLADVKAIHLPDEDPKLQRYQKTGRAVQCNYWPKQPHDLQHDCLTFFEKDGTAEIEVSL